MQASMANNANQDETPLFRYILEYVVGYIKRNFFPK